MLEGGDVKLTGCTPARASGIIHESLRNVHESYSWIGSWNVHEDPMNLQTGHHDDWNFIHKNKVQEYSWKAGYSWTNFTTEKAFLKSCRIHEHSRISMVINDH